VIVVATGAGDDYWAEQNLPSAFKHTLLDKYVPQFAGMTGSRSTEKRVVFLDGYAGRGRYEDGTPGSAERIMKIAYHQFATANLAWTCYFVEQDDESAAALDAVVAEYVANGVDARAHHGGVEDILDEVLTAADGLPLCLFLDPTGLGLPYDVLVRLLSEKRRDVWPPNGGAAQLQPGGGPAHRRARPVTARQRAHDAPARPARERRLVARPVQERCHRRGGRAGRCPVHRRPQPGHPHAHRVGAGLPRAEPQAAVPPGVRHPLPARPLGVRDSVARATQAWWDTLEEVEAQEEPDTLFSVTQTIRPTLDTVEAEAIPVIADNLAALMRDVPTFKTVDETLRVFGGYYGQVRERVVRQAVRRLHATGGTGCTGVGGKPRDLIVSRP
jgi:hypothetical protein